MKTKHFLLCCLAVLCSISTFAHDFEVDGIYYNKLGGDSVAVTYQGYSYFNTSYSGTITITATVEYKSTTYRVTSIGEHAFYNCAILTSVTIPNSVTTISSSAFWHCYSLTEITIPNSVTTIGNDAFYGCSSLTAITIPNRVTSIGDYAFSGCTSLTTVTWNAKDCKIRGYSGIFGNTYDTNCPITTFTFGNEVKTIPAYLCQYMKNLTAITIRSNVTSIGKYAFYDCSNVETISVESGNPTYHSAANCLIETANKTLILGCKNSVIPNDGSVTTIGSSAFYGCSSLTAITIPNSVTTIGNSAFDGCSGLTSVTIGENVTSIGSYAFRNCSGLTSVTIPNSVTDIGNSAFYDCTSLTEITIPNSVTTIGNSVFQNCSSLTAITIPNSVTSIGNSAFAYCSNIETIIVEPSNPSYHSVDNCLIETVTKTLIAGCKNSIIPTDGSVTAIGHYAFAGIPNLTEMTIPNSITTICNGAFQDCSDLTSITIPNSVTTIGAYAFDGCPNLQYTIIENVKYLGNSENPHHILMEVTDKSITSCTIHEQTKIIGYNSFQDCSNLTEITIPDSVISIGDGAFETCYNLTGIALPNNLTSIGNYAFYLCRRLTEITIPESVTYIGGSAFYVCTSLTEITIPNSVTSIGDYAFSGCSGLTEIILPNNLTSIGHYVFRHCSSLTAITIPNSVTTIGNHAFYNCSGLTSITIPNSVTSIGRYAFQNCYSLTAVTIGNSVTTLGDYAFSHCSGLTEITIPNSVTTIGDYAFYDCDSLSKVTSEALIPPTIASNTFDINPVVYVHYESEEAYKNAPYWSELDIQSIKEFEYNGISYKHIGGNSIAVVYKDESDGSYENEYAGTINIPATVEKNNTTYNVTTIGDYTFYNCSGLTSITIPESVTTIGSSAFLDCAKLRQVTIGSGIEEIGDYAFSNCTGLISLSVNAMFPPLAGANTFENVSTTALITVPCAATELYKAANYWNAFTNYQDGLLFAFSATSADKTQGKVTITQKPTCDNGAEAIFEAKPAQGYEFVEWNDGDTDNPRTVEVIEDVEYIATFAPINDAVEDITADNTPSVRKVFEDGTIYILKPNGNKYTIDGRKVE